MQKIFGTATLHSLNNKFNERVVNTALKNGFSQFDTAGVYGLGSTNKYLWKFRFIKESLFLSEIRVKIRKNFWFFKIGGSIKKGIII
jgi:diketogulonate reductase-like aldo/keto reductase